MKPKLLWRYLFAQILDGLIIFGIGALILTGYLGAKNIDLSTNGKYALGAFSAIFWIGIYTIYIPWINDGRTPMRSLFRVGIKFPQTMSLWKLFMVSTIFLYSAPMISFGVSILINIILVLFTNKGTTIEQKLYSIEYIEYDKSQKNLNFRGTEEELEQQRKDKQKRLHPNSKKRKRK